MAEVKKPLAAWDEDRAWDPPITVYETVSEPVFTGVLDATGTKIFRRPIAGPIGFDLTRKTRA
jgi:hypothetical protein